jgi:NADH-quinone oxidoreductase subunit L
MEFLRFDPDTDFQLLLAALLSPLVLYVVQIFVGRHLPRRGDWLLTGGMFATMCITVYMAAKAIWAGYHGVPFRHHSGDEIGMSFHWLYSSDEAAGKTPNVVASIFYDSLGAAMLAVVGIVSFFVHLFSTGYMKGDKRYHIFFANISLFTFAMLGLVLSDNILFLFIFWELMGLMSYLLIGHFSHDPSSGFHRWATWASKKAFMTTRVGDCCLLVGMLMFYREFHTFRFTELWQAAKAAVDANGGEFPTWMTVAGLFVFGGTVGKSAQFPLHIWLPDAMAGPTPVSAMIHAATMVAAGVFLLGRTYPLMSPDALAVITVVGAFTALFAATMGITAWDLKAVLAYSTISQLGFMVAAVGLGNVTAGMFHMVTHAFFKACLFLSAGSVIHGCHHEQDMRMMGGLRKKMPVTFACTLACTLAIAGIPLFSGFYSKDMILAAAFEPVLGHFDGWSFFALLALSAAAAMTAFYMFRMIFLTFFGEYRGSMEHHMYTDMLVAHGRGGHLVYHDKLGRLHAPKDEPLAAAHAEDHGHAHEAEHGHGRAHGHDHAQAPGHAASAEHGDHGHHDHVVVPHESPPNITIALVVLALLGVFGGHFWLAGDPLLLHHTKPWFVTMAGMEGLYGSEIGAWVGHEVDHAVEAAAHGWAVKVSLAVALGGFFLALFLYHRRRDLPAKIARALGLIFETVRDKYYVDEFVDRVVVGGSMVLARTLTWIDRYVVDGLVLTIGRIGKGLGHLSAWFDRTFVDGAVDGVAAMSQAFGSAVRLLQTGRVQQYAVFAVAGAMLAAVWLILL